MMPKNISTVRNGIVVSCIVLEDCPKEVFDQLKKMGYYSLLCPNFIEQCRIIITSNGIYYLRKPINVRFPDYVYVEEDSQLFLELASVFIKNRLYIKHGN